MYYLTPPKGWEGEKPRSDRENAQDCWGIGLQRMLYINLSADINVTIIAYKSTLPMSLTLKLMTLTLNYSSLNIPKRAVYSFISQLGEKIKPLRSGGDSASIPGYIFSTAKY